MAETQRICKTPTQNSYIYYYAYGVRLKHKINIAKLVLDFVLIRVGNEAKGLDSRGALGTCPSKGLS